jgi:hypothetical protein
MGTKYPDLEKVPNFERVQNKSIWIEMKSNEVHYHLLISHSDIVERQCFKVSPDLVWMKLHVRGFSTLEFRLQTPRPGLQTLDSFTPKSTLTTIRLRS